jgi:serine/threonine protein kinase
MLRSKCPESNVGIVDFGLSTYANAKSHLYHRCGTPGFMAPETFRKNNPKRKVDPVGDIFSLGLIFHILYYFSYI